jgi:hypothetical protein
MRSNVWIRQVHRWLSIVFTVAVIANFVAMGSGSLRRGSYMRRYHHFFADVHRPVHVCHSLRRQVARIESIVTRDVSFL